MLWPVCAESLPVSLDVIKPGTYIRLSLTEYDSNLLNNMLSFFLSFSLVGNFLTYKSLPFCFDLHVRTFRFGSSKTNISPLVDEPRQEPWHKRGASNSYCAHATALLKTSLFIDRFSHEFWLSNKPQKSISKNRRLEDSFSDVLKTFTFSFCYCRPMDAHSYRMVLQISRRKVLPNGAKNKLICENAFA